MNVLAVNDIRAAVDGAFVFFAWSCGIMMTLIALAIVIFVVKYRRSTTPRTEQVHGNTALEVIWVTVPTIIVMYMFYIGYQGFKLMRDVPDDHMVVEVTGQQWKWSYYYPDLGITTTNEQGLFLPGGVAVKFNIRSLVNDVLHSFYLPDFRVKEDSVPGRVSHMWIRPDMPQPGERPQYNIFCAEYCGADHSKMISKLTVLTPDEYVQWVDEFKARIHAPIDVAHAMDPTSDFFLDYNGKQLFEANCVTCHGSKGLGEVETGYANARDLTDLSEWKQGPKKTDIFRTLNTGVTGTNMRSFKQLSLQERFALMHYAADFYKGDQRPADTQEDIDKLNEEFKLDQERAPKDTIPIEEAMDRLLQGDRVAIAN